MQIYQSLSELVVKVETKKIKTTAFKFNGTQDMILWLQTQFPKIFGGIPQEPEAMAVLNSHGEYIRCPKNYWCVRIDKGWEVFSDTYFQYMFKNAKNITPKKMERATRQ